MKPYVGTKIILGEPMERADAVMKGLVRDSHATIGPDGHSEAGYMVIYEDGYRSWSPKGTFERAYRLISDEELRLIEKGADDRSLRVMERPDATEEGRR